MRGRIPDKLVVALILTTAVGALCLPVNPAPFDGWYKTQYYLFGSFLGQDNYAPIAAPAILFRIGHALAVQMGGGLVEEFYIASVLQNLLVLASACFVYYTLKVWRLNLARTVAIGYLLLVLSTGLPQAFWSETVVLFLMSAVVLVLALVLNDAGGSAARFWSLAIVCGVMVGALVVTRATPVFLIPAIALLFFYRMPFARVIHFTGTITMITVLALAATVIGNHFRFGRYELTNSSGRRLWAGVKDFSDRALGTSEDYQALKRLDPNIEGKSWWELPAAVSHQIRRPGAFDEEAYPLDPLLTKLAFEAIWNEPILYLKQGAKKFVITIGAAPYNLASYEPERGWNPLGRSDLLPPLWNVMKGPGGWSAAVQRAFEGIHRLFEWLYPVTIFAIAVSYLALVLQQLDRFIGRCVVADSSARQNILIAVFVAVGPVLVLIPLKFRGLSWESLTVSWLCATMLGVLTAILIRSTQHSPPTRSSGADFSQFSFLVLVFFGTLWVSWQEDTANSRLTIPFLPFWSVMLAQAAAYWKSRSLTTGLKA
jgi:hypothetical protein